MDVFGRGASPRMGGPLGKASGGKRNRWFANLLLGVGKEKKITQKNINLAPWKQQLLSVAVQFF